MEVQLPLNILPRRRADRFVEYYSYKGRTVFWDGKQIKCEHKRKRNRCKDCGGSQICEHNRRRSQCKDCGGSQICEHKRLRSQCKDCGGSQICEHKRLRSQCKDCGGSKICEHKRQRGGCKDCGGSQICEHKRQRGRCKDCGGSQICEHKRQRSRCKDCGGSQICEHKRQRRFCKDCDGSQICEHKRQRRFCKDCGGGSICEHNRIRSQCKDCSPYKVKEACFRKRDRYYKRRGVKPGDIQVKVWEQRMIDYLKETYPACELILGRSVGNSCTETGTHRYPDVQLWLGAFLIVFECDERAHRGESYTCDYRRMNEIAISVGSPVWFIRWNPHGSAKINEIETVVSDITSNEDIGWEHNKQFNVSYIGYTKRDELRNENRMIVAV